MRSVAVSLLFVLVIAPGMAFAQDMRGLIYDYRAKYGERRAITYLDEQIRKHPKKIELRYILADIYKDGGAFPLARAELLKASAIDPSRADTYRYLAELSATTGDIKSAERYLDKALSIAPKDHKTLLELAQLHSYLVVRYSSEFSQSSDRIAAFLKGAIANDFSLVTGFKQERGLHEFLRDFYNSLCNGADMRRFMSRDMYGVADLNFLCAPGYKVSNLSVRKVDDFYISDVDILSKYRSYHVTAGVKGGKVYYLLSFQIGG